MKNNIYKVSTFQSLCCCSALNLNFLNCGTYVIALNWEAFFLGISVDFLFPLLS